MTEDMRERVLANMERELARPARRRVSIKRVAALAACLVLVIVAAVTATSQMNPGVVQVAGHRNGAGRLCALRCCGLSW